MQNNVDYINTGIYYLLLDTVENEKLYLCCYLGRNITLDY